MSADHPVTDLMDDHRLIETVMSALESRLNAAGEFPAAFVEEALAFFVEYADRFHHFKEEDSLFPALSARGVATDGGPIGMMLQEHALGRRLLAGVRDSLAAARGGDEQAQASVRAYAAQYTELLRGHIWKEDNVLFMMARRVLDESGAQELLRRFRQGGQQVAPEQVQRHQAFAAGLRSGLGDN